MAAVEAAGFPYPLDENGSAKGFVGLSVLRKEHAKTLAQFKNWVKKGDYRAMHSAHYDWWMFPLDERSSRLTAYVISPADAQRIAADAAFLFDIREGVKLLLFSWGWDIDTNSPIPKQQLAPHQAWTRYPVRLFKAGRCMQVLGQGDYFAALLKFAKHHHEKGDALVFSSGNHNRGHTLELWAGYTRPVWPGEKENGMEAETKNTSNP